MKKKMKNKSERDSILKSIMVILLGSLIAIILIFFFDFLFAVVLGRLPEFLTNWSSPHFIVLRLEIISVFTVLGVVISTTVHMLIKRHSILHSAILDEIIIVSLWTFYQMNKANQLSASASLKFNLLLNLLFYWPIFVLPISIFSAYGVGILFKRIRGRK